MLFFRLLCCLLSANAQTMDFALWSAVLKYFLVKIDIFKLKGCFSMTFQAIWRQMLSCLSFAIFSPRPSVCAISYTYYNYGQYLSQNAPQIFTYYRRKYENQPGCRDSADCWKVSDSIFWVFFLLGEDGGFKVSSLRLTSTWFAGGFGQVE